METEDGSKMDKGTRSRELLQIGSSGGLYNNLLINPKPHNKQGANLPITRIPRSSILDRVQNFLPQMAMANENLSKDIESSPDGAFDIEYINTKEDKIIEMNVAVVELSSSESSEDEEESSSDDSSNGDLHEEVTEDNIKLRQTIKKGKIEVLGD